MGLQAEEVPTSKRFDMTLALRSGDMFWKVFSMLP